MSSYHEVNLRMLTHRLDDNRLRVISVVFLSPPAHPLVQEGSMNSETESQSVPALLAKTVVHCAQKKVYCCQRTVQTSGGLPFWPWGFCSYAIYREFCGKPTAKTSFQGQLPWWLHWQECKEASFPACPQFVLQIISMSCFPFYVLPSQQRFIILQVRVLCVKCLACPHLSDRVAMPNHADTYTGLYACSVSCASKCTKRPSTK